MIFLDSLSIVVIGGGAAGFFAALAVAEALPDAKVRILEKSRQLLSKVRISGGGRCNVTHHCFDATLLTKNYPRGNKELRGPFSRFQPIDTIKWFKERGVELKIEEDGRIFPTTDDSETIINCFLNEAGKLGIEISLHHILEGIEKREDGKFILHLHNRENLLCDHLIIATGSTPTTFALLKNLGHKIIPLLPSLFTFNLPDSPFLDLAGIAVEDIEVSLPSLKYKQRGPLLLTHWGISGPAVLKLSAWGARDLHEVDYKTSVEVNWIPSFSTEELLSLFTKKKKEHGLKSLYNEPLIEMPKQLWRRFLELLSISITLRWVDCSLKTIQEVINQLRKTKFEIVGKTTYKQEFVTAGGIALEEIDFRTMQSRLIPNLYFAGEVLNIDGITGGFNFQNAWTTGWIAAQAIRDANQLKSL